MSAEEIVKKLDPLLARLTELAESQASTYTEIVTLLQQIAKQLGVPGIVITPPAAAPPTASPVYITVLPPDVLAQIELHPELAPAFRILNVPLPVVAKPNGSARALGNITTTATFQTITSYKPAQGKTFNLTKIVASCNSDYEVQLYWKTKAITVIYKQMGKSVLTDWFPFGYGNVDLTPIVGDGTAVLELKGRFPTGGAADDLHGEIVGEET